MAHRLEELERRRQAALHAGSETAVERQHSRGKMTARERLDYLLDPGSFQELDMLARSRAEGRQRGQARLHRRRGHGLRHRGRHRICTFSQDFTVNGGTLGEVSGEKIHKVIDLATSLGVPLVGINDGGGARVQEGVVALHYYGGIFRRNVAASGVVPQISVIMGSCAGGAVYSPAITDFVFMVQGTSQMFITGPDVVKTVTGEDVTLEELGGALTHATKSGVASFVAPDEKSCLDQVRQLLGYLPANKSRLPAVLADGRRPGPPRAGTGRPRPEPFPAAPRYEGTGPRRARRRGVFRVPRLVGLEHCLRLRPYRGPRRGRGGQPAPGAGGRAGHRRHRKRARFVRTCDCFNIPVITFVDVPGFMPGTDQEHGGMARRGAKLLYAYCEAAVPKIQLIVRRAYGAAYVVMGSKSLGADLAYAWPGAELAVVGPESAVDLLYSSELAGAPPERRGELVDAYREANANPYLAAERGYIDDVIEPARHAPRPAPGTGNAGQQTPGGPGAKAWQHTAVSKS